MLASVVVLTSDLSRSMEMKTVSQISWVIQYTVVSFNPLTAVDDTCYTSLILSPYVAGK